MDERPATTYVAPGGSGEAADRSPPPGQQALALAALLIGLLLMGIQLWLLTVALDLYLAGAGRRGWLLAAVSGLIFVGGLLTLRLLGRRPPAAVHRPEPRSVRTP
jgi:hypothetical protein